MKNIQVVDDALNCLFKIYSVSDADFELIFPSGQDVTFADDFVARVGEKIAIEVLDRAWASPMEKKTVLGIHGTMFYGERNLRRKPYFPTGKESEMVALPN